MQIFSRAVNTIENLLPERQTRVTVTPDMAARFLATSEGNRNLRVHTKLISYKRDMERGAWVYNGDALRFSPEGVLLDGHHRCSASVETGVSFESDIVVIPQDSVHTVDRGALRSDADSLVMEYGYDKALASTLAGAVKIIISHDREESYWPAPGGAMRASTTYHVVHDWLEDHKTLLSPAVAYLQSLERVNLLLPASQICAARYLGARAYGVDAAETYMNKVLSGYNIQSGTTESHVREILLQRRIGQRKMHVSVAALTLAKGMRSRAKGREIVHRSNAAFSAAKDTMVFYR